jgi:hypothetical protein
MNGSRYLSVSTVRERPPRRCGPPPLQLVLPECMANLTKRIEQACREDQKHESN